jgi:hypothetical protein
MALPLPRISVRRNPCGSYEVAATPIAGVGSGNLEALTKPRIGMTVALPEASYVYRG